MKEKPVLSPEEESDQDFERRLHMILDLLIAPKNNRSPPVLTPEPTIDSWPQIIDNRFEYPKRVEKPDFVRSLDLIKTRDLKRKPIAYLNSRHPLNEISRSIYAGIATKKSVLDFPAPSRPVSDEESADSPVKVKRKRYSLLSECRTRPERGEEERLVVRFAEPGLQFSSESKSCRSFTTISVPLILSSNFYSNS